jgi:hypothetical protein
MRATGQEIKRAVAVPEPAAKASVPLLHNLSSGRPFSMCQGHELTFVKQDQLSLVGAEGFFNHDSFRGCHFIGAIVFPHPATVFWCSLSS